MIKDRIKELREKNGLTISAFAKSLGISPTSASLYESGKQNPGKKTIGKICEVYGVDEGYLSSSAKEVDKAPTNNAVEKKRGRRPKKTDVVNEEKEPDIPAILARVAEVGVRKAATEFGVAWQTVNKWKKDAEKAALSSSEEIQKEADNLTTPEGAQEAVNAPDEGKKEPDISAILARVAEIGVRKAAEEAGVAWQTVNKWKKDAEKAAAALPAPEDVGKSVGELIEAAGEISDGIQNTLDNLTTPEGAKESVTKVVEMVTPETEEKKEIDINAVLARVAEIGVRKAAGEIGVAWQTVNKWKKDAEKAALPSSEAIQKEADNLTTPEGAQEAVTKVMEMVTTSSTPAEPAEVKETAAPAEEKKDQIDITAILARVAEIGVRKAAAEIGVAWQTVSKWKKDAEKMATPTASIKEEKKEEKKPEEKKTAIIIQSPLGGNITPRQVLKKIPAGSDSVYIRVDENKLYWVKGDESGAVDIWD